MTPELVRIHHVGVRWLCQILARYHRVFLHGFASDDPEYTYHREAAECLSWYGMR